MNIVKRYAKGLSLTLLTATSFSLAVPAVLAQSAATPAAVQSVSIPENVLAAVKLPALPALAEKLMDVSRKAELDAQTQMFLMLGLSQFGFPGFPGVSKSDGVTLFVLSSGSEIGSDMQFVTLAKLTSDSPMRQTLQGYGLTIEDRDGWALVSHDPAAFAAIKDFAGMTAIASSKSHFDVEARAYSSKSIQELISGLVESGLAKEEVEQKDAELIRGWLQLGIQLLDRIEWIGYGLSLNEETLSLGGVFAPKAGTPEAALLNAPTTGGKVAAGQFLPADVAIGYVAQFNVPATEAYIKSLSDVVKQMPNKDAAKLVQDGLDAYLAVVSPSDGGMAAIITELDIAQGKAKTLTIGTGKYELSQVDGFYNEFFNKLMPSLFALLGEDASKALKDSMKSEIKTGVAKVSGQNVNVLSYTTPDPENPESEITQETFYTVIKGALLSADTLDGLKTLAESYTAGKPLANNLADAYPLPEDTWLKGSVNVKVLAESLKNADEESVELFKAVSAIDPKPILYSIKYEGGHAVYNVDLSVDTVVKFVKLAMGQQPSEEVEITEIQVTPAN